MRPIALLTDFGVDDHYAGVLHAVLLRDAPGVERLDLSHRVPPGDVWTACFQLQCAWPFLPDEAVTLAVVDPGVGTARRGVATRFGGRWLVAPDNGLSVAAGDPDEAVELLAERMGLPELSATFHGRDLFAPAAARLARGEPATAIGESVPVAGLEPCPLPRPERTSRGFRVTVLNVDRFGNLVTNLPADEVAGATVLRIGAAATRRVHTYSEGAVGEPVALRGSSGHLEVAVNRGSAAAALGLGRGDTVEIQVRP